MPPRHHILFFIVDLAGGTGNFTTTLAGGLRRMFGHEFRIDLLMLRNATPLPADQTFFDNVYSLGATLHDDWRRVVQTPRNMLRLHTAIEELSPDLVFTIGTFSNIIASLAVRDRPVVMSDHLNMTERLAVAQFGSITGALMRWTYPRRLMIGASRELVDDLRENFGVRRAAVIPNGTDAAHVRHLGAERAMVDLPERFIVAVGRLVPQKDFATLLRAYHVAVGDGIVLDLMICGDGEQRAMLEALASELHIAGRVRFLGHQPNPYPVIKAADFLVLSSVWEGFAFVPVEAMVLGVPCICTDCPSGPAEIVGGGEFGLLVPRSDPPALAAAMLRLSRDSALRQLLSAKSLIRADELSIENMAVKFREAFLNEIAHTNA